MTIKKRTPTVIDKKAIENLANKISPPIGGSFKSLEFLPTFGINGNM